MSADQIRAQAAKLAELFAAKANGKTLQMEHKGDWYDRAEDAAPDMQSNLSRWRVKPEPRTMWTTADSSGVGQTTNPEDAQEWRRLGYTVTEWKEVEP